MSFYFLEDESVENGVKRIVTEEIDEAVQKSIFVSNLQANPAKK